MKIANIEREILDLRNFNEIFRKDVSLYDNIKNHKKP